LLHCNLSLNIQQSVILVNQIRNIGRLSNIEKLYRTSLFLGHFHHYVLIGMILSDGHLRQSSSNSNVRINFRHGEKQRFFIWNLFELFQIFTTTGLQEEIHINKISGTKKSRFGLVHLLFLVLIFIILSASPTIMV